LLQRWNSKWYGRWLPLIPAGGRTSRLGYEIVHPDRQSFWPFNDDILALTAKINHVTITQR